MKRFSLMFPLLCFILLCGCGSEKDVPEAMPHQDFASDSAGTENNVFQSSPAPVSYPLEDAPTLTLYYPLSDDSLSTAAFRLGGRYRSHHPCHRYPRRGVSK